VTSLALETRRAWTKSGEEDVAVGSFPAVEGRQWLAVGARVEALRLEPELWDALSSAAARRRWVSCLLARVRTARLHVARNSGGAQIYPALRRTITAGPARLWHWPFGLVAG
jgi:hypothetical protein